jgi:hypothetical protein
MIAAEIKLPPGQFHCKAIRGDTLLKIIDEICISTLSQTKHLIIQPHPVTGNLLVFRKKNHKIMDWLGWIDVADERFHVRDEQEQCNIPAGWKRSL